MALNPKIREWLKLVRQLGLAALLIFGARSAIADWNLVPSGSMNPTIIEGDLIFVNRLAYDLKVPFTTWHIAEWANPKRGEIVVFFSPANGERLVKRVVGVPGDTIALHRNRLFINGRSVDYRPLDGHFLRGLEPAARGRHRFAEEVLDGASHPMMVLDRLTPGSSFGPVQVPDGKYLMLGDNRDNSADSRYFGFVDRGAVVGRATRVIVSWNSRHFYLPRKDRFFAPLP